MTSCEGLQAIQRVCKLRGAARERAEGRGVGNTALVASHGVGGGENGAYMMPVPRLPSMQHRTVVVLGRERESLHVMLEGLPLKPLVYGQQ